MSWFPLSKEEVFNTFYQSLLITGAGIAVSMGSKKILKEDLEFDSRNIKDFLKMTVAVGMGSTLVLILQKKKIIPVDPWK